MIRAVMNSMIMSSNSNQNGIIKTVVVDSFVVFEVILPTRLIAFTRRPFRVSFSHFPLV